MAQPQFVPSPLKIIERRRCQNCGATLIMTGIEAIWLGTDRRTFACDQSAMKKSCLLTRSLKGPAHDNTE
jgi:hypothetical protein